MPADDPYTTREIKDKFDGFSSDLAEIKRLLTGGTYVNADVYNVQITNLKTRLDTMQATVRNLSITLAATVVGAILTAILTTHP